MNETIAVVLCTFPSMDVAEPIAKTVVDEHLAACVTMMPGAVSVYSWEGAAHRDEEVQCIMKTTKTIVTKLQRRVTELHPYDVPEFIALDVTGGLPAYLKWVVESTTNG